MMVWGRFVVFVVVVVGRGVAKACALYIMVRFVFWFFIICKIYWFCD